MQGVFERRTDAATVRGKVFENFSCFPGHLERIIAKALGCSAVRIQAVLGCGAFNLVLEALICEKNGEPQRRFAFRLPLTRRSRQRMTAAQAISGHAATLFMSNLNLPAHVVGPVHLADPPLPYAPRGRSHLTVMPVLEGRTAWRLWGGATLEWKKTMVADLAAVVAQLYRNPLQGFGCMALSADGVTPGVGPLHDGAVTLAVQRGMDVGGLSPGPYPTWKDFARSEIQGLVLLFGECPLFGEAIKAYSKTVLEWLETFEPRGDGKSYLVHPDFATTQVMVDAASGHVQSIVDWDSARARCMQSLASSLFPFDEYDFYDDGDEEDEKLKEKRKEKEVLLEVYEEQLRQGGAGELVQYVVKGLGEDGYEDPQVMFEQRVSDVGSSNPITLTSELAHWRLQEFCSRMDCFQSSPEVNAAPPWKRSSTHLASSTEEEPFSSSSSRSSCRSSSSSSSSSEDDAR